MFYFLEQIFFDVTNMPFVIYVIFVWAVMLPRPIFAWIFLTMYWKNHGYLAVGSWRERFAKKLESVFPTDTVRSYPKPDKQGYAVSLVITMFREEYENFERNLRTMKESLEASGVDYEIIVVMDGVKSRQELQTNKQMKSLFELAQEYADVITIHNNRNKREGLADAIKRAKYPIIGFGDSDTFVEVPAFERLLRVFHNPRIGGATTAQRVEDPKSTAQILADWLESARLYASMPFAALFGQVGCLPGRLYVARKSLIEPHLDKFVNEYGGILRKILRKPGDDRFITMAIMRAGYMTTLVPDASVTTLAPEKFADLIPQQSRWATTSQWYTIESLPWLWRFPATLFVYATDILVTIGTVGIVLLWIYNAIFGVLTYPLWSALLIAFAGMSATVVVRQAPHLRHYWRRDLKYVPIFSVYVTVLQFVRFAALVRPKWGSWQTRGNAKSHSGREFAEVYRRERD